VRAFRSALLALAFLTLPSAAQAGLYCSLEPIAELPSQWRGFLLDQRALRQIAVQPARGQPAGPLRPKYEQAAQALEKARRTRPLSAEESADLGALYVRLGEPARAIDVLREAQARSPHYFRILANLGTAWQVQGDLGQAEACLQQAVRLAPGKLQRAEEYQLRLVRSRQRRASPAEDLDDLFGVRYAAEDGSYQPGRLSAAARKQLPSDAVALVQELALWLPADGRLLWQLAELANAHGDVRTAAAMFDGCVTEFGLRSPELRRHRQETRAAADQLAKRAAQGDEAAKQAHEGHAGTLRSRSSRPLVQRVRTADLPPVSAEGVNPLPWSVLAETSVGREFRPTFARYLRELDGLQVSLSGFMQPIGEGLELGSFLLIEYPVGCWYCQMPELAGIVLVELPAGKTATYRRSLVKVTGRLELNATDPENFLYTLHDARVTEAD
jgi:hypothetical protein